MLQLPANALHRLHRTLSNTMPKKKVAKSSPVQDKSTTASPVTINKDDEFVIQIHAKPGAKITGVTGINSDSIDIQIAAPPMDGEANAELIKYISSVVGVRKGNVNLDKGSKSRTKTVTVTCQEQTVDGILSKFREQIEN